MNASERGSISNMSSKSVDGVDIGRGLRPGYQIGLERINNDLM